MLTRFAFVSGVIILAVLVGQPGRCEPPVRTDHYGDPLPPGVVTRLGTERLTLAGAVGVLKFSPDGRRLAAYDTADQLYVWDVSSGKALLHLKELSFRGSGDLAFSPDGKWIAKGCGDQTLRVWDVATGKELHRFSGLTGQIQPICFSPEGRWLFAGAWNSPVHCWDLIARDEPRKFGEVASTTFVALSRDGKTLTTGSTDPRETGKCLFTRWDTVSGKELGRHALTLAGEWFGQLSPDGSLVARPEEDGKSITLLDPVTGRAISRAQGSDYPSNLVFSADGARMSCRSKTGIVQVWDTAGGKVRARFQASSTGIDRIALSPDGKRVALTGRADNAVHVWDVATGRELHSFAGHRGGPLTIAFRKDGREIVTVSRDSSHVFPFVTEWADWSFRRWDAATGAERAVTKSNPQGEVYYTTFSPDGRLLATVIHDGTLRLWDVDSGKELRSWKTPTKEQTTVWEDAKTGRKVFKRPLPVISAPVFSPDGKVLLAAHDPKVLRWEVGTGRELPAFDAEGTLADNTIHCVLSPEGRTLAVYRWRPPQESFLLLDAASGKLKHQLKNFRFWTGQPVFSPDGRTFAFVEIGGVSLWEVASGRSRGRMKDRMPFALAFSPDGRFLAAGSDRGTPVILWDLTMGQIAGQMPNDLGRVDSLAFSPDGSRLAVAGYFATALVCDVAALCGKKKREEIGTVTISSADELEKLWAELAHVNGARAYRAIRQLGLTGPHGAAFLRKQLTDDKPPDERRIAQLIADLDDNNFATREKASAELGKLGVRAEPSLRKALEGKVSAEVRSRIKNLLGRLATAQGTLASVDLVRLRVVEALEANGSDEARQVLAELVKKSADTSLAMEAKGSLERLSRRPVRKPESN